MGKKKKETARKKDYRVRPEYVGQVRMNREGLIFVRVEGQDEDIYVRAPKSRGALHEDTVRVVETKPGRGGGQRREGEIIAILERSQRPVVGILHVVAKRQAWVLMSSKTMPYDISVPVPEDPEKAVTGLKVAAVVDGWDRGAPTPHGHIVDFLGKPGENETEMHAILAQFGLPYRFEKAVEDAADAISDKITEKDLKGRRDFRDILTFTIDPVDAKDYDDALSFRKLDNGNYEVGVHIADVTYYVRPGTPVDKEAQLRGTSVYLVDRTVPMLPEKLSNKLCSLRPYEDKLTFSAVFEVTPQAKVINPWFGRTVMRSDYRFDYDLAQQIIEAGEAAMDQEFTGVECGVVPAPVKEAVLVLNGLALKLRKKRFAAGALEFDRPEMKVVVDDKGKPVDVIPKTSKESNWLIEEFMLLANRHVAEFVATDGHFGGKAAAKAKTFVYRVHDLPNTEKLEGLRGFAGNFGHRLGDIGSGKAIAESLNNLLVEVGDRPEKNAIQLLMLRAMAKACYSTDNIGHYGLAFPFYTHFTSPIRRYPDMMVHRLLALYLNRAESQDKGFYENQCKHASDRELVAAEAERESIKYKVVEYMEDKVGREFDGTISGLTEWGMYVEVEPTKIEGMIPLRTIKADFYDFDADHYRLVGRRTRKVYLLGDKVRVRVKETNLDQKLLDYELVEEGIEDAVPSREERFYERPAGGRGAAPRKPSGAAVRKARKKRRLSVLLLLLSLSLSLPAREKPLPQRDSLRVGTLRNGLTYYILQNSYPKGEAVYRLFVKAGSLYEEERQRGLAHFLEHMAFNGTEHFPDDGIIRVLERHGAAFGTDLNAHTSYGETVYKLQLPTGDPALVDTTMLILRDWARGLTIDSLQVEKERGVILSERLQRRKAGQDASDAFLEELLGDSRFAVRKTIGDTLVIQNCSVKDLRDFYTSWYRPSLMAVAVVGDVDPDVIEAGIRRHFADMPRIRRPKPVRYGIDPYADFAARCVYDSTLTSISLDILQKASFRDPVARESDYRPYLVRTVAGRLCKQRFNRLSFQGPDYKEAAMGVSGLLGTVDVADLSVTLQKGKVRSGIAQAVAAARQILDYGFTAREIEQVRRSLLSSYRNRARKTHQTASSLLMDEVYSAFYIGDALVSPQTEYALMEKYLPTIDSLTLVAFLQETYARAPFHAMLRAPESLREECGDDASLAELIRTSFAVETAPYRFQVDIPDELCAEPAPGRIVSETAHPEMDLLDWKLSNGARVLFRKSALSRDKISLSGSRKGGFNALDSTDYYTGLFADKVVPGSGAGAFSRDALRFYMSGSSASALFVGAPTRTGILCSAFKDDIETMFQLFYLRWTAPQVDTAYARLMIDKSVEEYRSREPDPQRDFSRELGHLLSGSSYTNAELTDTLILSRVDVSRMVPVFNKLYGSADDYTFVLMANMDAAEMRPYVERYLAALPGGPADTVWVAPDRVVPKEDVSLIRHTAKTEKAVVSLVYQGTDRPEMTMEENTLVLGAVKAVVRTALLKRLREDMGKVYSVGVSTAAGRFPSYIDRTTIQFSCKPEDAELLVDETVKALKELTADPSSMTQTLADVRANLKKEHAKNLQMSSWYGTYARNAVYHGEEDWTFPSTYPSLVDALTPERIAERIETIVSQPLVKAILYPEKP